jgi:hypothetical protein
MEARFALFADLVSRTDTSKLNINGIFNLVQTMDVPAVWPLFYFVGRVSFPQSETGRPYGFTFGWVFPDGTEAFGPEHEIVIPVTDEESFEADLVLPIANMAFATAGKYFFVVKHGDIEILRAKLAVTCPR